MSFNLGIRLGVAAFVWVAGLTAAVLAQAQTAVELTREQTLAVPAPPLPGSAPRHPTDTELDEYERLLESLRTSSPTELPLAVPPPAAPNDQSIPAPGEADNEIATMVDVPTATPRGHGGTRITSTYDEPWSAVVKLKSNQGECSASVLDSFHLATAAHCLWNPEQGWVTWVTAFPGQTEVVSPSDQLDHPFGRAEGVRMWAYDKEEGVFFNSEGELRVNSTYDQALIELDRPIGERTGGFGYENGRRWDKNNFAGYPGETDHDLRLMYHSRGPVHYESCNLVKTIWTCGTVVVSAGSRKGNSGGPIWAKKAGDATYWQQGIISGTNSGRTYASGARFWTNTFGTRSVFNAMENWMTSHTSPTRRPELIEYVQENARKDIRTNTVEAGAHVSVRWNVYNVGFANTGRMTVRFYLSTDRSIRSSDTLIRTITYNDLEANTLLNGQNFLQIPANQPPGTYYVGYTMGATVREYTTQDNVVLIDERLTVTVPPPDLVVPFRTVSHTRRTPGQPFTFSATVRNVGRGSAPRTNFNYIRRGSGLEARGQVGPLAAGASSRLSMTLTAPQTIGTYAYYVCAVPTDYESDRGNNCSTDVAVTVSDPGVLADRAALAALYNATGGRNWVNRTNWFSNRPLSEWFGITTDGNGRVTALLLSDNALSGPIPTALGNLANLQRLYLQGEPAERADPDHAGESRQPPRTASRRQRVERADPDHAGEPRQPPRRESRRQPVERVDPGGARQPGQPRHLVSRLQSVERADPGGARQPG